MDDSKKILNKIEWREAATGGLYLGIVYAALSIATRYLQANQQIVSVISAISFFSVAGFLFAYASRMSRQYGVQGYTFFQSMRFILKMSMFAGVIAGIGMFIQNRIAPEIIQQQLEVMRDFYIDKGWDAQLIDQSVSMTERLMLNPLFVVFGGIGSMILYGGLIRTKKGGGWSPLSLTQRSSRRSSSLPQALSPGDSPCWSRSRVGSLPS